MYQWSLHSLQSLGVTWGKVGWLAAFIYMACAALRLARFNTQIGKVDKRFFVGLPSPAAAAMMISMVWACQDMGLTGKQMQFPALFLTLSVGLLMVSNISYYSFKDFNPRNRVPFVAILVVVLVLALIILDPPKVLLVAFSLYTLSGPALWLWRRYRRSQRRRKGLEA
jgi:CDP-diacylglycerol--serine O-phosphatidyltransferase